MLDNRKVAPRLLSSRTYQCKPSRREEKELKVTKKATGEKRERKKSDYAHLGHFQFVAGITLTAAADRSGHIVTISVLLMQ